ncbi:hypothetical protein SAY87_019286 [Trapa incisa]|uniref:Nuclear pore complex protein n=1 Tax=Trapa incisa TaxID=236973 RepID=A0AAN7Q722_9MYRT|nr:hypothetical protein SAY87_019286 [Trapa incisa]
MATEGLGAGGKFRKKPFRRPQSTPYDRPPTASRAPTLVSSADGDGWLRKLMDPAQKILATTARRFYNSVFRKRLTQPPTSPPLPSYPQELKEETFNKHAATTSLNITKEQDVASSGDQKPTHTVGPSKVSSNDLEEILKQKSFTRSEIEHLVALLRDRVVDNPVEKEVKTPDVLPSRSGLFHQQKEQLPNMQLQDFRSGSNINSINAINSSVFGADDNSPSELARAYMGISSSKVSQPVLGLRNRTVVEDSPVLTSLTHPPKSPILSLVPSSSGHVGIRENDYATHRSRGRSAIYSMARAPYSRVHAASAMKSPRPTINSYDGPSSTAQTSEGNRIPGSSKPLKRSSAIFENDIGSGGPMRRIRPKPNLSYSRNWTMSTSEFSEPPSSSMRMQPMSGKKHSFAEQSNVVPVSSKSGEMATKILQQLEKIVSPPKERSSEPKAAVTGERPSAKLSPSKMQGQASKSLEYIDSSKLFQFTHDNNKPDDAVVRFSGETNREKDNRIEKNGPFSIFYASDTQSPKVNDLKSDIIGKRETVPVCRTADANAMNSIAHSSVQKTHAFKMSADVDFLDSEDDGYSNGVSSSVIRVIEKQDTHAMEIKPSAAQATSILEKHQPVHDEHERDSLAKTSSQGANGKPMVAQTCANFNMPSLPAASTNCKPSLLPIQSLSGPTKATLSESNTTPIFSSGVTEDALKKQHVPNPVFGFASHNEFSTCSSDKNPQFKLQTYGELTNIKTPLDSAQGLSRVSESDTVQDKKNLTDGVFSGAPDGATGACGVKKASPVPTASTVILADSNTIASENPLSIPSFPVTFNGNSGSSKLSSTITSTTPPSNTDSQTSSIATEEAKHKPDISFGNISNPFSAVNSNSGNNIFGFGVTTATLSSNNQKESYAITRAANGSTPVPESPAVGVEVASFTQNAPIQFGLNSSSNLSTFIAASTSSSSCDLSTAAKPFSSGVSFGSGTLSSSQPSFLGQTSSSLFGQTTATPTFASSLNSKSSSTVIPFDSSSSAGSSFVFGAAPGSSSAFSSSPSFGLSGTSIFGSISSSSTSSASSFFGSTGTSTSSAFFAASAFGSTMVTSSAATGSSSASCSAPTFGLSGTSSSFGSTGSSPTSGTSSVFGSSCIPTSSASPAASVFGSNMAPSNTSPIFGSMGASSGPTFSFTSASSNPTSGPTFSFSSAAASPSPSPVFGSTNSLFTFGSPVLPSKSPDQMIMEDSMAEDVVQSNHVCTPAPVFGQQQPVTPPSGFVFGSNASSGANPFQFGAQQNVSSAQSPSPFQASGSLDFNAGGGSFSLGTGGGDKSGRKIVKINRNKLRRK